MKSFFKKTVVPLTLSAATGLGFYNSYNQNIYSADHKHSIQFADENFNFDVKKIEELVREVDTLQVVSVLGLVASGKSTLMNKLFFENENKEIFESSKLVSLQILFISKRQVQKQKEFMELFLFLTKQRQILPLTKMTPPKLRNMEF
jgi:hypothetical protein